MRLANTKTEEHELWGKKVNLAIPKATFPSKTELAKLDEAMMPEIEHGWFESSAMNLHYIKVGCKENPKGAIVLEHGISAHIGFGIEIDGRKYGMALLNEFCIQEQLVLYGLDMVGHGFSEGTRALVPTWEQNRDDLGNFCKFVSSQYEGIPFFTMGHSYGGCIVLLLNKYWRDNPGEAIPNFSGMILISPAIKADIPPKPILNLLENRLAPKYPEWIPFFMPNPITPKRVWRDPAVRARAMHPKKEEWGIDHTTQPMCLSSGVQLIHAFQEVGKAIPTLTVPFCVIQSKKDKITFAKGTEFLLKNIGTPKQDQEVLYLKDATHDILCDPDSEKAIEAIRKFVKSRI